MKKNADWYVNSAENLRAKARLVCALSDTEVNRAKLVETLYDRLEKDRDQWKEIAERLLKNVALNPELRNLSLNELFAR